MEQSMGRIFPKEYRPKIADLGFLFRRRREDGLILSEKVESGSKLVGLICLCNNENVVA